MTPDDPPASEGIRESEGLGALGLPVPGPGWVDLAALAAFVPPRPEPVTVLPRGGRWRIRTEDATVVIDLEEGTVRRWEVGHRTGHAGGCPEALLEVHQCEVGQRLRFSVLAAPRTEIHTTAGDLRRDEPASPASPAVAEQASPEVVHVHNGRVFYLEALPEQGPELARTHVHGWADTSLPAPLRAAHLCAASYFGATRAELGQAVGLSGRQVRDRLMPAVMATMVTMRAERGDPERVPLDENGQPRTVARWMTEERVRRRRG